MEEEILFPALEKAIGITQGPTFVIRSEHVQTRSVPEQMEESLETCDIDATLASGETFLMLMQQQNMKEEEMLYTMADQHLSDETQNLIQRMKDFDY